MLILAAGGVIPYLSSVGGYPIKHTNEISKVVFNDFPCHVMSCQSGHCQPLPLPSPHCDRHIRAGAQVPEEARARHSQHRLAPRQHALHGDRANYTR